MSETWRIRRYYVDVVEHPSLPSGYVEIDWPAVFDALGLSSPVDYGHETRDTGLKRTMSDAELDALSDG